MKILLVNNFFYLRGGAEATFFNIANLLKEKGHKVCFFSTRYKDNYTSEYEKYFIEYIDFNEPSLKNRFKIPFRALYSIAARRNIEELLEKEHPDIAHLHNIYHQISPSILHSLKKNKIPVVMTLHDYKLVCASYLLFCNHKICERCSGEKYYKCFFTACVKNSRPKSLLNMAEMYLHHRILKIYDLVDIFISPTLFLKGKLGEMGFKRKIVHLPYPVMLNEFNPSYSCGQNCILYVGRLSHEKGLDTLIEAVKRINGVTLKIIGTGPSEAVLKEKIRFEGIKNIFFLGYKTGEELKAEIRNSMFTVVPSEWYENFPNSVLESFALGKPVVGSRIGGIPELVIDGVTGLTFEPGDHIDLREKVQHLLNNPFLVTEMGKRARKKVENEYNSELHYQKLMNIYNKA